MTSTAEIAVPTDEATARQAVRALVAAIGNGFHPDDHAADYVNGSTGQPSFTDEEAEHIDAVVDAAFALLDDIYAVALDALHAEA